MVNLLIALDKTMITSIGINIFSSFWIFISGNILLEEKRKEIFNKEFLIKNFYDIHKKEMNEELDYSDYGYPDDGSGLYSQKLSYKDWYNYNKIKRIYDNGIEVLNLYLFIHLIASLISPDQGLKISIIFLVSRSVYLILFFFKLSNIIRISGMVLSLFCILWCLFIILYYLIFQ